MLDALQSHLQQRRTSWVSTSLIVLALVSFAFALEAKTGPDPMPGSFCSSTSLAARSLQW